MSRREATTIFAGGALGAAVREGLILAADGLPGGPAMPIFIANMTAVLVIGLAAGTISVGGLGRGHRRVFLTTGIAGGMSTFSSLIWSTVELLTDPSERTAGLMYLSASMVVGLILVWLGYRLGQMVMPRGGARRTLDGVAAR